jgi:predicted DNA-binding transcriptional regulator YafY
VSRSDLMSRFGISAPQASDDIAKYLELAPGNLEYDRVRKAFIATPQFKPHVTVPDARQYLTQLLMLADHAIDSAESWLGHAPMHAIMPRVRRRLDADTLRPVVSAIRHRRAIEIQYQSMSTSEPTLRWIAPHALVYDGARWHARSWCFNRSTFTDFVLARILSIGGHRQSGIDSTIDREWQEEFTIRLAPHPDLSSAQRQAIEMDYGMIDGCVGIPMRLCMTWYFERHYGLDIQSELLPPSRRQIVLQNRVELEELRASCRGTEVI